MARKTLVIGAGFTGGALARLLRDARYASEVLVWEKSSIAGGRAMARYVSLVSFFAKVMSIFRNSEVFTYGF